MFLDKMRNVLSQAHGLDSTFDIDIIDRTFNETCCEERGVPYECMANCKDARGPIYEGYRMGKLQSRCTKYNHIIENCIITGNMFLNCKLKKVIKNIARRFCK